MNTKIIIFTRKLIAIVFCLTLASSAFGSDFDQNEEIEENRECVPEITEEETLLQAIERAGGFKRLIRQPLKDERPVPAFPTDGSTMLATTFGNQPTSANKSA